MSNPTLLSLNGSLRAASVNQKLLLNAVACWPEASHVQGNLRLPLYDGDLEQAEGIPAEVTALAEAIEAADAVIISTPEYNKGLSGVLKNALDWVSRVEGNPWLDKPVLVMSATAGRTGGERGQMMLIESLWVFRPRFIPGPAVLVAAAHNAFDDAGTLTNEMNAKALKEAMAALKDAAG
ncbi:NADPH-dependent FMN reductase [Pseudaestuariivita sp.]|uniref:NADPH-dependent FMN reductase n=1 Tax=Pseudaestuariivita sp. TaxID=2211669 RepID=UPI00405932C5